MQAPVFGVRTQCASVRCASRCGNRRSIRPHHGALFQKPRTMMRSNLTARRHGGSQIARARTPCEQTFAWTAR
eukprot:6203088-Lingulodinium_polyedra.AAC.1